MPNHYMRPPTSRAGRAWVRARRLLAMLGVLLLAAAVVYTLGRLAVDVFGATDEGEPSPAATVEPSRSWPVETVEPAEDLTAGEGTFLDPAGVDRTDPDAVAEAAATLLASHDTALDDSEADALHRAGPLLDPALLGGPSAGRVSPGPSWLAAQGHRAYSTPAVTPLDIPALSHAHAGESPDEHAEHEGRVGVPAQSTDGEDVLAYEYQAKYHWQGRDGWLSDPDDVQVRVVQLSLAERDGQWVVVESFYGQGAAHVGP